MAPSIVAFVTPRTRPSGVGASSPRRGARDAAVALMTALLASIPAALPAQEEPAREGPAEVLASALDSAVAGALEEGSVPGAVVVVVRDGQVLLARGYGAASREENRPMDAAETVLPVGSLAKPVTAAAALRLAARDELDLGADVRPRVAGLELPIRHDAPVTLAGLLTHTAGFDDTDFGDAARRPDEARPLRAQLARRMPVQSFAPGRLHRYSNHGYALAGHLLAEAAGAGYAATVRREVFAPLGMDASTVAQVPAAGLRERVATSYRLDGVELRPVALDHSNVAPADGLLTTGRDMGRLLLALTDPAGGALGPDVRRRMLATAFRYHDSLPGVTLAFRERPVNGRPGLEHTGGRLGFTSQMVVVPGERLGLFVLLNRRASGVRSGLAEELLDRLLPPAEPAPMTAAGAPAPATDPARLVGTYRSVRYARHTLEKVAVLLGMVPEGRVEDGPGKAMRLLGSEFYEVDPLLFRWSQRRWHNAFRMDGERASHLFSGHQALERVPWHARRGLHRGLFLGALAGLLAVLGLEARRAWGGGRGPGQPRPREVRAGERWTRRLLAASGLALLAGLGLLAATLGDLASTADYGPPPALVAALGLLLTGALLATPLPLAVGVGWARGWWTRGTGARLTAGVAAVLLLVGLLGYWNLLGFRY